MTTIRYFDYLLKRPVLLLPASQARVFDLFSQAEMAHSVEADGKVLVLVAIHIVDHSVVAKTNKDIRLSKLAHNQLVIVSYLTL
jgi:hypothetical protein